MEVRLYPHKNKFYKSVTSIISLVGGIPEELNRWSVKLGVQAALQAPQGLSDEEYIAIAEGARQSVLQDAQVKGRTVHSWIESHLSDAQADIAPEYEPYYRAFLRFKAEHDVVPIMLEKTVVNEDFGYAGTFDFYGCVDGEPALLDFKTSRSIRDDYAYQLAAYREVLERSGNPVHHTYILHLRDTGRYTLKEFNVSFGHFVPWITVADQMCKTQHVRYTTATVENALIAESAEKKTTSSEVAIPAAKQPTPSAVESTVRATSIQGRQRQEAEWALLAIDDAIAIALSDDNHFPCSGQEGTESQRTEIEESPIEPPKRSTRKVKLPGTQVDGTSIRIMDFRPGIPIDAEFDPRALKPSTAKRRTSQDSYGSH